MRITVIILCSLLGLVSCSTQNGAKKEKNYSDLTIGKWLGPTKFEIFYLDGTWGVQRHEKAPIDKEGRFWKLNGNKLTLHFSGESATQTIVYLDNTKFVTQDEGYSMTRNKINQ